jgi:hypothetical protein
MRVPALNRLLLPGCSGDFPPILHQYTSAIRPDDEARAIQWITFYAYYALCAPHEALGCPLSSPTLGWAQPHNLPLSWDLYRGYCAQSV